MDEQRNEGLNLIASVFVPLPVPEAYDYYVPEHMPLQLGSVVKVFVGPRPCIGIVKALARGKKTTRKLRAVSEKIEVAAFPENFVSFIEFMASYTLTAPGLVAKMALRFLPEESGKLLPALRYHAGKVAMDSAARKKIAACVGQKEIWTKKSLSQTAQVSPSVIEALKRQGAFEEIFVPEDSDFLAKENFIFTPIVLEGQQKAAVEILTQKLQQKSFSVALLEGVTGSGKTEVYFSALAEALKQGGQIVILLPEIALTQQFIERFTQRFGRKPVVWHSGLSAKLRNRIWRKISKGRAEVVVGARSALFLPFQNLNLIIVDEEHDAAFKQEENVFYNARDMAVARAKFAACPIILCSATPSLESRVNAMSGKYTHVQLKNRYAHASFPRLEAIDLRKDPAAKGKFLSPILLKAMEENLKKQQQTLLFLNRRGYAPLTICQLCGHRFSCPHCSSFLVQHRLVGKLICHHCGYGEPIPQMCSICGEQGQLIAYGAGVERISEEVLEYFPQARQIVLSTDLGKNLAKRQQEFLSIEKRQVDIIIGTQLVTKGHNFLGISLVGVVDADLSLMSRELRAAERSFQTLFQVTGRAGRDGKESRGFIQSHSPENPIIQALLAGNKESFYRFEIEERHAACLPPFGRLAGIVISAEKADQALNYAKTLCRVAPHYKDIKLLGPVEAPLALWRDRFRFRLLLQGSKKSDVQGYIRQMLHKAPKQPSCVKIQIDIDPQSFF